MKKAVIWLLLFAVFFTMAGCVANMPETPISAVPGDPYDPTAGEFPTPPKGYVVTDGGNVALRLGGYNWNYKTGLGTGAGFIADQAEWPMPLEYMQTVTFPAERIDGVDLHLTEDKNENIAGYPGCQVSLAWQVPPDAVSCICWHVDHETNGISEIPVECTKDSFIAKQGSFIYEFSAGWLDHGRGYSGKASYYIHVIVETED